MGWDSDSVTCSRSSALPTDAVTPFTLRVGGTPLLPTASAFFSPRSPGAPARRRVTSSTDSHDCYRRALLEYIQERFSVCFFEVFCREFRGQLPLTSVFECSRNHHLAYKVGWEFFDCATRLLSLNKKKVSDAIFGGLRD